MSVKGRDKGYGKAPLDLLLITINPSRHLVGYFLLNHEEPYDINYIIADSYLSIKSNFVLIGGTW